ncbi:MAG TPA: hypothetical protein VFW65_40910 [Pseudonocardiaceae bacterium]|nr:hypothetical protein [Pseudonocardiaceae bacterium]
MTDGSELDAPAFTQQQLDQQVAQTSRQADQLHHDLVQVTVDINNADGIRPSQMAAYERIQQEADAPVGGGPGGASGGNQYTFDPTTIEQQLAMCEDLIGKLRGTALPHAQRIAEASAPSSDDFSVSQATATSDLGNNVVQRVLNQITFVRTWHDKLVQARQQYLEQEHLSVDQWRQLTGGLYT